MKLLFNPKTEIYHTNHHVRKKPFQNPNGQSDKALSKLSLHQNQHWQWHYPYQNQKHSSSSLFLLLLHHHHLHDHHHIHTPFSCSSSSSFPTSNTFSPQEKALSQEQEHSNATQHRGSNTLQHNLLHTRHSLTRNAYPNTLSFHHHPPPPPPPPPPRTCHVASSPRHRSSSSSFSPHHDYSSSSSFSMCCSSSSTLQCNARNKKPLLCVVIHPLNSSTVYNIILNTLPSPYIFLLSVWLFIGCVLIFIYLYVYVCVCTYCIHEPATLIFMHLIYYILLFV